MPGAIEKEHFRASFEKRTERDHRIVQVCARAMDEDHGRKVGAFGRRHMHHMETRPSNLDEGAVRREATLGEPCADTGHADEREKHREEKGNDSRQEVHGQAGKSSGTQIPSPASSSASLAASVCACRIIG